MRTMSYAQAPLRVHHSLHVQGKAAVLPSPSSTAPSKSELLSYDQYQAMFERIPPTQDPNRPETAFTGLTYEMPASAYGSMPPTPVAGNFLPGFELQHHSSNGRMAVPGSMPVLYASKQKDPNEMPPAQQRAFLFRSAINKQTRE